MSLPRPDDSNAIYSLGDEVRAAVLPASPTRQSVIDDLRSQIRRIEGAAALEPVDRSMSCRLVPEADGWTLGVDPIDRLLGPAGIDLGGIHEIRSGRLVETASAAATTASRRVFALLLAVRLVVGCRRPGAMLWCMPAAMAQETGVPSSRGLAALGLDPDRVVIATPTRASDVLWVVEEAIKASCLSIVLGEVKAVGVTASRRLSLAAAETRTPCLLVSPAGRQAINATATRWRVAPAVSGVGRLDPTAPGPRGFLVGLERCRAQPLVSDSADIAVEWSDAARRFRMAADVPDRAHALGATSLEPDEAPIRSRGAA